MKRFMQWIRVALMTAVVGYAPFAVADPLTYGFSVHVISGPLAGVNASGQFTFDSSIIPVGGGLVAQSGLFTDFSFTFDGVAYDETTANTGFLLFDAASNLTAVTFGNDCVPGTCATDPSSNDWFVNTSILLYAQPGATQTYGGTATIRAPGSAIPEPSTVALLLIGLSCLMFGGRRQT